MNDAARLVDELTTLLYETLKAWQTQDGRHHQIVRCGACHRKADKPESVIHDSDCPVYRLQRAEAVNDAIIKANAEEIADLEDARDAADARANAEWARAEGEQRRADVADLRADRVERFAALWKLAAKIHRDQLKAADSSYSVLEGDYSELVANNARLRERLATVEAVLSRYGEESNWFRTFHPQDDGWLQPVWAWDTMEDPKQIARAALAATPAAVPDEDVAMILPPVMTFGKRQSLPDFDRREQRQHGGEG